MNEAPQFFLGLWRWAGAQRENILTECVAAAFREDPVLLRGWLRLLSVEATRGQYLVETQRRYGSCIVDLVTTTPNGRSIGIEHKLDAPLGLRQLQRYVGLRQLLRVALISRVAQTVPASLRSNGRYACPGERPHFAWSDLYTVVEYRCRTRSAPSATLELASLMRHLGFEPPLDWLVDLSSPDPNRRRASRTHFRRLWDPLKKYLDRVGWSRFQGSISQLYLYPPKGAVWRFLLDPKNHGALRIRIDPRNRRSLPAIRAAIEKMRSPFAAFFDLVPETVPRVYGHQPVLDVWLGFRVLFEGATGDRARAHRLTSYVRSLMATAAGAA